MTKIGMRTILILQLALFFLLNARGQEIRLGINYSGQILPKAEVEGKLQVRRLDNQAGAYYTLVQAGVQYDLFKNISVSGSFRYSLAPGNEFESLDLDLHEKTRYTAEFRYKTKRFSNDVRLSNRLRYQHSAIQSNDQKEFIRNKIVADYKMTKAMKSYVAVEPYFLLDEFEISKCRLYVGSVFDVFDSAIEVCFIIEGKMDNKVISTNQMIGIYYNF